VSATVTIVRKSEQDIKMRDFNVRIDDQESHTIQFGQSTEFTVEPGHHELKATNGVYHTLESFDIAEGETIQFEGINKQKVGLLSVLTVAISGTMMYRPILRKLDTSQG
jgi:hypothetical protein